MAPSSFPTLLLTLKIKVILPAKMGYSGIVDSCNLEHESYGKAIVKSNKREQSYFVEKEEEVGRVVLN